MIGEVFTNPTIENNGDVIEARTLDNDLKYLEFVVQFDNSQIVERRGRKIVPLLRTPPSALPLEMPEIRFIAITVRRQTVEPGQQFHTYALDIYKDSSLEEQRSRLINVRSENGDTTDPVVLSYPLMLGLDERNLPTPMAKLKLRLNETIALDMPREVISFSIKVQLYVIEEHNSPWIRSETIEASLRGPSGRTIGDIDSSGRVSDSSGRTMGYLRDGRITDSSGRTLGSYRNDGSISDSSGRTLGRVKSDGTVRDSSGRSMGRVRDGRVSDSSGRSLGSYPSGVLPMVHVAVAFFFFFF